MLVKIVHKGHLLDHELDQFYAKESDPEIKNWINAQSRLFLEHWGEAKAHLSQFRLKPKFRILLALALIQQKYSNLAPKGIIDETMAIVQLIIGKGNPVGRLLYQQLKKNPLPLCDDPSVNFGEHQKNHLLPLLTPEILQFYESPNKIYAFKEGQYQEVKKPMGIVVDPGNMLVVELTRQIAGSDQVLDLCAAPGTKSKLLQKLGVQVVSGDLKKQRFRFEGLNTYEYDATKKLPFQSGEFPVVLADLPCYSYGTIGKNPDLRYHQPERAVEEIQEEILLNVARQLQPQKIIYSICSFLPEETQHKIPGYEIQDILFEFSHINGQLPKKGRDVCWYGGEPWGSGFFIRYFKKCETG